VRKVIVPSNCDDYCISKMWRSLSAMMLLQTNS